MNTVHSLVERYIPFADKIAALKRRTLPKRITIEELQSAAYLGLVESACRFDSSKGIPFTTFAYPRIFGAIIDYLRELGVSMVSLDSSQDDEEQTLAETIAAPKESAVGELFDEMTTGMDEKAKTMLRCYYLEDVPMKDVGRQFGVTESRVSQLLSGYREEIMSMWEYEDLAA